MIVRQFCARHGRTVLARSSRRLDRGYVSSRNVDNPMLRQSERDPKPKPGIPGHPDEPSSILDTLPHPPTAATRSIAKELEAQENSIHALRADVQAHTTARIMSLDEFEFDAKNPSKAPTPTTSQAASSPSSTPSTSPPAPADPLPFDNLKELNRYRRHVQQERRRGTHLSQTYDPTTLLHKPPKASELTLPMLLANQTHLGHATSLWNPLNSSYIFGVRDGIHIISLEVTHAYLKRAAKVVQEVARRGGIILFVATRKGQEEIVVNTAKLAGGYHIFHRWVPGSLTNGQQILGGCGVKVVDIHDREIKQYRNAFTAGNHTVMRPDLVVCLNPLENQVCLHECGIFNVPTIGIIDTDANPAWVTYPIPANDDSLRSAALIGGVLGQAGKEGQRLRQLEAMRGSATYPTHHVHETLQAIETIAALDVQEPGKASERD
ncbi:small subunit ribosomal protein S2 [Capronia coronata CBS 617.96]|uniref:Small subunit ribosomal protein S2 n=1 Tax=Capronia coronata CBS 617.96 TaxID=1182541 RepID=W9Z0Z4_9EURO|nr:small subunit ribosomal protein S2 [Capronia coronata CBS 617.96]EXJ95625.1 small subunit ribosomal protein S2 [Capronia coronata CBS 617.96]